MAILIVMWFFLNIKMWFYVDNILERCNDSIKGNFSATSNSNSKVVYFIVTYQKYKYSKDWNPAVLLAPVIDFASGEVL